MNPIRVGKKERPFLSFMVNIAWGNEYIESLLEILKKNNIKLTFFMEGRWVQNFPSLASKIKEAGHEIGNHGYSHSDMRNLSNEEIHKEIDKTNQIIRHELNVEPKFFTPPFGYYDKRVIDIANDKGMSTILWTLDTLDWKIKNPQEIIMKIVPSLNNGYIILMHPTQSSLLALPEIIDEAKGKGYSISTITDVLSGYSGKAKGRE